MTCKNIEHTYIYFKCFAGELCAIDMKRVDHALALTHHVTPSNLSRQTNSVNSTIKIDFFC